MPSTTSRPSASLAFATTGIGFEVGGVPLAKDSALLDAGLDFALSDRLSAGVSYQGQYADNLEDNAVKGRLTWLFNWRSSRPRAGSADKQALKQPLGDSAPIKELRRPEGRRTCFPHTLFEQRCWTA